MEKVMTYINNLTDFIATYNIPLWIVRLFIALLIGNMFFMMIYVSYESIKYSIKSRVAVIDKKIVLQKKRKNDFSVKIAQLKKLGVLEKSPRMAQPLYYYIVHGLVGIIFALFFSIFKWYFAPFGFIIGILLFKWYLHHRNKTDNEQMTPDIMMIYNILTSQIKGGVYMADALSECRQIVKNKRLKKALEEFHNKIYFQNTTVSEAIDDLESKFDNINISSLCMIVRQTEETGRSIDVLKDISKQLSDIEEVEIEQKKMKLERTMSFVMIILFGDIMGFVFYTMVREMLSQATFL